ncbi:malonate decarboxylase acyl carrier protein [Gallaecimonas mangrovi]|uniref:malonate decarboxylase acyl carrier protein n=1 Tax=Gallaecimonas mangrovi TaxID=2291597 RepID=UPI000E206EB9|nr:malonate decarboxylase acyl carrier protein [Gallaecimonas mangrovi]
METFELTVDAKPQPLGRALVGCVASGDLEVMIEPNNANQAQLLITSNCANRRRWQHIVAAIAASQTLPAMRMDIHDFAATPGVIRLRIEQALAQAKEEATHGA